MKVKSTSLSMVFIFLGIGFLSTQPVFVKDSSAEIISSDEIIQIVNQKYQNLLSACMENGIQQENMDLLKSIQDRIGKKLTQLLNENRIPIIEKHSASARDLGRIYEYILRSTLLNVDGRKIRSDMLNESNVDFTLEDYIAERLAYELILAVEIEKLNPSEQQTALILEQAAQIKICVINLVKSVLPDAKEEDIQKAVNIHFKKYELSPSSVMQLHAKRPLKEAQLSQVMKDLKKTALESCIPNEAAEQLAQSPDLMKPQIQFFMVKDFVRELDLIVAKPFHKNLPEEFRLPVESDSLIRLRQHFENS
ncbi:MAG: hypothetical protein JXR73_16830 [Candidatus Omnitrophica bacterium]|nr:hypothetical protein [Candidatus Omnitrophota bacterium]